MIDSGYMTADEMKACLNLKSKAGDNRTLNKYVINGILEIKPFSRKVKMYRVMKEIEVKTKNNDEWIF